MSPHPRHQLDEAFQTPIRLSLMAALGRSTEMDFKTLRELLEADDSVLSKSIAHLEKAGYVRVTKGYAGSRPKTWVQASAKGYSAFQAHLAALRAITESMPTSDIGDDAVADSVADSDELD